MSKKHIEQAQDIFTAVGGIENVVNVSRDTNRLTIQMNHAIPSTANEVKQIAGVKAVEEHDEQFIIMFKESVEDIYKQLQLLIEKDKSQAGSENDNTKTKETKQTSNTKVTTPILVKAPISGRRILLKEVRDSIFREEMVGEGLAIKAHDMSKIISPFTGTVSMTVPTKHAIGIHSEEGVDLVIHIGVNTVKLNGEGFECLVNQDDYVNSGQTLLKFDRNYIEEQGYNSDVIIVISNSADFGKVELTMNEIITTKDVIFKIFKN